MKICDGVANAKDSFPVFVLPFDLRTRDYACQRFVLRNGQVIR